VLVGVQPAVLMDYGGSLTDVVRARMREALGAGLATLAAWGVAGVPRAEPATALMDASLDLGAYEDGRPGRDEACRLGDARFLAIRRAAET
jgi:hydrogenase maturation protease